jgi:anaerobic ribonucleoside-triphosphate reductase
MKYYRVDFELKAEAMGTQDADEFIPTIVCVLHELRELFERYDELSATIVNVRPATDDEVLNCTHYYI